MRNQTGLFQKFSAGLAGATLLLTIPAGAADPHVLPLQNSAEINAGKKAINTVILVAQSAQKTAAETWKNYLKPGLKATVTCALGSEEISLLGAVSVFEAMPIGAGVSEAEAMYLASDFADAALFTVFGEKGGAFLPFFASLFTLRVPTYLLTMKAGLPSVRAVSEVIASGKVLNGALAISKVAAPAAMGGAISYSLDGYHMLGDLVWRGSQAEKSTAVSDNAFQLSRKLASVSRRQVQDCRSQVQAEAEKLLGNLSKVAHRGGAVAQANSTLVSRVANKNLQEMDKGPSKSDPSSSSSAAIN